MYATPPIVTKLLRTPVLRSELPVGYSSARITRQPEGGGTFGVNIEYMGKSGYAGCMYVVFSTPAAAAARAAAAYPSGSAAAVGNVEAVGVDASTLHAAVRHLRRVLGR